MIYPAIGQDRALCRCNVLRLWFMLLSACLLQVCAGTQQLAEPRNIQPHRAQHKPCSGSHHRHHYHAQPWAARAARHCVRRGHITQWAPWRLCSALCEYHRPLMAALIVLHALNWCPLMGDSMEGHQCIDAAWSLSTES